MKNKIRLVYILITALAGWFAIFLQLYLNLSIKNDVSFWGKLVNFISYFTILTNLLVAFSLTEILINPSWGWGRFFLKPAVASALVVYISIVGLVYFFALRKLWDPQGWQFVADAILHYAVPVMYPTYWLFFVQKGRLVWKYSLIWLIYPALYFSYLLIRGSITGLYPYPFVDVNKLGFAGAMLNALQILCAFIIMGLLIIGIDKLIYRRNK